MNYSNCLTALYALVFSVPAMAIDLSTMWDFRQPDVSEHRFRQALETAAGDDAFILQTQIARTFGLRKQFDQARAVLEGLEPQLASVGAEATARYWLELGRTYASATHDPLSLSAESKTTARKAYEQSLFVARQARLDGLAIDAIHMLAFVDTSAADQFKWAQHALAIATESKQPEARRWEASIRNNAGHALHQLGRYQEALDQFQKAVELRQQAEDARALRVAKWMVAWTMRSMGRIEEALSGQLALEREGEQAKDPDPYVMRELEALYRTKGEIERAEYYAMRQKTRP